MKTITRFYGGARIALALALLALLTLVAKVFAASGSTNPSLGGSTDLDLWTMGMGLLGGLALFLFGMEQMADALKALAADRLKDILARLTTNRFMGAITGAIVTAIIQSSSVTTVLTVGFITAGILSVSQAVGIIFGANIGTTLTAQIIAFKVTKLALLMIAVGFAMLFISRKDTVRQYGAMLMGLGLVFFGMSLMSNAMKPLRTYGPFLDLMMRMETPALGILVAAAFTGLVQSSSATTGVVIAMAGQGLISLEAGIALIFGANIGTCVTAMLASIGKPREALRASLIHVLFNVLGVVMWVWFIDHLAAFVSSVSPEATGLSGAEKLAAETPRQIANAHTIFNIANTLLLLPFGALFARLVEKLVPDRVEPRIVESGTPLEWTAVHLDPDLLTVPSIALEQTRGEILRVGRLVREMIENIMTSFVHNDLSLHARVSEQEAEVIHISAQINDYLIQISRRNLNQQQSEFATQLMDVSTDLKHIGDLIKKDLSPLLIKKAQGNIGFSEEGRDELLALHQNVLSAYDTAMEAFEENDGNRAREVVRAKPELVIQHRTYRITHYQRLSAERQESLESSEIHLDLVDYLRRIYSYAESIALTMLEGYLDMRNRTRKAEDEATG